MKIDPIATQRLQLVPATAASMAAAAKGNTDLARVLGVKVPEDWPPKLDGDDGGIARTGFGFVRDLLTKDPSLEGWWGWFVLLKARNPVLVGAVSPKGPPDKDGTVEVSYGVVASQQRQGLATEATLALMEWTKRDPRTRKIVAETFPNLVASIGVMKKCGLQHLGAGAEAGTVRYGVDVLRPVHLEGRFSVLAAITAGRRKIEMVLVRDDADPDKVIDVLAAAKAKKIPVQKRSMAALEELTHGRTHGGVVAVCSSRRPDPEAELLKILDREKTPFVLLLEGVDDDRNLAFTLRTAEALGVDAVILKKKEWDFDEADVCRSSSGAFERLCIVQIDREGDLVERLKKRGLALVGCVPQVLGTIHDAPLAGPVILAVGGEMRGLSGALRSQCTTYARIPMKPGAATSLSMSHAAAIAMAEVLRQRSDKTPRR